MLPAFIIGLREGLEGALIVGIVATFLARQGRRDVLRQVWIGVGLAVVLCLGVAVGLQIVSSDLPERPQAGLETVVALIAVGMVTYMILWMRRHSMQLKGDLEEATTSALARGSATALVAMAFLAVLREGFESSVFLLATFRADGDATLGWLGALLGIALAVGVGYGIYRGGIRLNLSRFFRATGIVLVVIAAGLFMTALHTAAEAGWLGGGQASAVDLSWLVRPDSLVSSLMTGVFGLQAHPSWIEVAAWLLYLVPMMVVLCWPRRSGPRGALGPARARAAVAGSADGTLPATGGR